MSRRHPTHEELAIKAANIEKERNKVSVFRPKITRKNPSDIYTPGEVERDSKGLIVGEIRPEIRYGQIPFSEIRKAAKATHNARGFCSRKECAFRNVTDGEAIIEIPLDSGERGV